MVNVTSVLENNVYSMLYNFNWDTFINENVQIFCATFCFFFLLLLESSVPERGVQKPPSKTVNLSISPFSSIQFYTFAYL